jgi:uncharacterized protein YndB with AHSA1/START domain
MIVEKSIDIRATRSRVWAVLTTPALTSKWSGLFGAQGPVESDWTLGGAVLWRNPQGEVYVTGRVVAMEPEWLLKFTVRSTSPAMQPISGLAEDDITQTYALSDGPGRTTLSIAHGDFAKLATGDQILPAATAGWDTILQRLKELAESSD